MTTPARRPVGETLAELGTVNPTLADEIRAELAAKRARDDLADAETLLREFARTDPSRYGRAAAAVLVEYDARAGRVVRQPERVAVEPPPRTVVEPPAPAAPRTDAKGDVIVD
jgi:hypothetical protein